MVKFTVATLNVRGLRDDGVWRLFLTRLVQWARRHRVHAVTIQEHNLQRENEADLKRDAINVGWTLVAGFSPRASERGGCLWLGSGEVDIKKETLVTHDLVHLEVEFAGITYQVAGAYAPSNPAERVTFMGNLDSRLPKRVIVGGDWNCVPDLTSDRKGPNALNNPNEGANILADKMEALEVIDIRREQLGDGFEHTRKDGTRATHGYLDTLRILGFSVFRIRILAKASIRIRILSADTSAPPRPECASHFWVAYLPFLGYRRMHVYNINEPSYDYIVYPM